MHAQLIPQTPKRRVQSTTVFTGILAVMALLGGLLFTSEALRHKGDVDRYAAKGAEAQQTLASITYDASGNVTRADRPRYDRAMFEIQSATQGVRDMRGVLQTESLIAVGALLAAVVLLVVAVRSTKVSTPAMPAAPRVVTI